MNSFQKFISVFILIVYFLTLPAISFPYNLGLTSKEGENKSAFEADDASAQVAFPNFQSTNFPSQAIGNDTGILKIAEINNTVVALGYGYGWKYDESRKTWIQGGEYVPCKHNDVFNITVQVAYNRFFLFREGRYCDGREPSFNAKILQTYGFDSNGNLRILSTNVLRDGSEGYSGGVSSSISTNDAGLIRVNFHWKKGDKHSLFTTYLDVNGNIVSETLCQDNNKIGNQPTNCSRIQGLISVKTPQNHLRIGALYKHTDGSYIPGIFGNWRQANFDIPFTAASTQFSIPNNYEIDSVRVVDSKIFSDGKTRFAVFGKTGSNPQVERMHIGGFRVSLNTVWSLSDVSNTLMHNKEFQNGISNSNTREPHAYILAGGSFEEAEGKILFGYSLCAHNNYFLVNKPPTYSMTYTCNDGSYNGSRLYRSTSTGWDDLFVTGARTDTLYYSSRLRMLFGANLNPRMVGGQYHNALGVPQGIWAHSFAQIANKCSSLAITPNPLTPSSPNQTVTITHSGTAKNPSGTAEISIVFNSNKILSRSGNATVTNHSTGGYSFSRNFTLTEIQNSLGDQRPSSVYIKVRVPGTFADSTDCVGTLGLLLFSNPVIDSVVARCNRSPYNINFKVSASASNAPLAKVSEIALVLMPSTVSSATANSFKFDVSKGDMKSIIPNSIYITSDTPSTSSPSNILGNNKNISFDYVRATNRRELEFNIFINTNSFDSNKMDLINTFLSNGFSYTAYVRDSSGRTNLNSSGAGTYGTIIRSFYDDVNCVSGLTMNTSNGDVGISNMYHNILRGGSKSPTTVITTRPVSEYLHERFRSNARCSNRIAALCQNMSSVPAVATSNVFEGNTNATVIAYSGNSLNISADSFKQQLIGNGPFLVQLTNSSVQVIDDLSVQKHIVFLCATGCSTITVNPVGSATTVGYNTKSKFQYTTAFQTGMDNVNSSRLYINPRGNIILGDLISGRSRPPVYNGAFITSEYLQTSNSYRTNIIRGFVTAKGVIASGGTGTNAGLNFRDFSNPVLHITNDPKYIFLYSDILTTPADTVPRRIVGI